MEFQEFNNYPSLNLLIVKLQTLQLPIEGNDNRFVADYGIESRILQTYNYKLQTNSKMNSFSNHE